MIPNLFLTLFVLAQEAELPVLRAGEPIEGVIEDEAVEVRTEILDAGYTAAPTVALLFRIEVADGGPHHVELRSWDFDAYLVLRDSDGGVLAENDDGVPTTHARVVHDLEAGAVYLLEACALHGKRGAFELELRAGAPRPLSAAERVEAEIEDQQRRVLAAEEREGPMSAAFGFELSVLGLTLHRHERYAEMREAYERALIVYEEVTGPESPETATILNCLAAAIRAEGDLVAARPLYERALAIREEVLGPDHLDVAENLNHLAGLTWAEGDLATARRLYERALAIREKKLGPRHPETATLMDNLAVLLVKLEELSTARTLYERALAIREEVLGPEHLAVATSLNNLAGLAEAEGDFEEARLLFERALGIRERALGPDHPGMALSLNNLAFILTKQGRLEEARPLYERALAIREETLGPEHLETAQIVGNLASLLEDMGETSAARPLYERALSTEERFLGPEHLRVASALNNLALLLHGQGELSVARAHFERALAIVERALGPDHSRTAVSLNNLATLLVDQGELAEARPLYERAIRIQEEALGPMHPDLAVLLNNQAQLLQEQGELAEARRFYERALAISEDALGPEHVQVAASLHNLASLYRILGERREARILRERALAIYERSLGRDHPNTAAALGGLGTLLSDQREYAAAQPFYEQALAIQERTLGPRHADTAESMANLAYVLRHQGELASAGPLSERALAVREEALGPEHPEVADSLTNLALVRRQQGDLAEAAALAERGLAIRSKVLGPDHRVTAYSVGTVAKAWMDAGYPDRARSLLTGPAARGRARLQRTVGTLTEGESLLYLATRRWQLEVLLSVTVSEDPGVLSQGFDGLLAWKGQVARTSTAARERVAGELTEEQCELVAALRAKQVLLSRLLSEGSRDPGAFDALRRERDALELELRGSFEGHSEISLVTVDELRAAIPPRAAVLVAFVHRLYRPARLEDGRVVEGARQSREHLVVWIARPEGEGTSLARVDLGPAAEIEEAIGGHLRALVRRSSTEKNLRGVVPGSEGPGPKGAALRERLWDPLAPHLKGVETLVVSPDGFLGTLPFETVELEDGSFLIEELGIVYLSDVTSLVRRREPPGPAAGSLLAVGAVDFDHRSKASASKGAPGGTTPGSAHASLRGDVGTTWATLPATESEVRAIAALSGPSEARTLVLTGEEPTEERLKQELQRHEVLHLATHGFFNPEGMLSMWESARQSTRERETRMAEELAYLVGRHPGLLSGLVCAGANTEAPEGADDGYLTAEEVGWLDLSKVELVVMSACETGLGRAASGEGLIGLRRAFRSAGAKTVISSLWQVEDESTAELMRAFYENLWVKGMGRLEALRAAQLAMLARNRAEHGDALPHTWGAFVLSGEWR